MSSSSAAAVTGEPQTEAPTLYTFGPFRLDLAERQLWRDEQVVPITGKAFDVLTALVRDHNRTVTKDALMRIVWHDANVSEESLSQAIYVLRRALGDDSKSQEYVATVARRGYRFIAPVQEGVPPRPAETPPLVAPEAVVSVPAPAAPVIRTTRRWPMVAALLVAGLGAGVLLQRSLTTESAGLALPVRFTEAAPEGTTLISGGVLSADSRALAFVARDDASDVRQIWVKTLDSGQVRRLAGTESAFRPFWSTDGQSLGFFADGRLKTVAVESGQVRVLASVGKTPTGGSWGPDRILFADISGGVFGVSPVGGDVRPVTTLDAQRGETGHRRPQFLPDGRHFLFSVAASSDIAGTYVGSLDNAERVKVLDSRSLGVTYAPPGYLVFVRDGTLMAQRFDPDGRAVTGEPGVLEAGAVAPGPVNSSAISATANGMLTFGGGVSREHLAWFDRTGRRLSTIQSPPSLHDPTLSRDGRQLLAESANADTRGIWRIDVERGSTTRLMNSGTMAMQSPQGDAFVYSVTRGGSHIDLFLQATSQGGEERLLTSAANKYVSDWTGDGRSLLFVSNEGVHQDVWLLAREKDAKPLPLLHSQYNELQPSLSPDGRWLAYTSDESGSWEVYVQAFPGLGQKRTISVGGGAEPLWRQDGRELYYIASDNTLMAVDVRSGQTLEVGQPRPLFRAPISWNAALYRTYYRRHYAAAPDGSRFAITAVDPTGAAPLTVLLNWTAAIR